jgi:hypothetical protein
MGDHSRYAVVRTGDILLFCGWSRISASLRLVQGCRYSHAAVAIWLNTDAGRRLYCLDTGLGKVPDFMTADYTRRRGCRLADMDSMARFYTGFACRHLQSYPPYLIERLREFVREVHHRAFRPFTTVIALNLGLSDDAPTDQAFCSELCSMWLERVGARLSPEMPHYRISPSMLGDTSLFGHALGEVRVVRESGKEESMREMVAAVLVLLLFAYMSVSILATRK